MGIAFALIWRMEHTRCEECGFDTWNGFCDECDQRARHARALAAGAEVVAEWIAAQQAKADAEAKAITDAKALEKAKADAEAKADADARRPLIDSVIRSCVTGYCPRCNQPTGYCTDECLLSRARA